MRAHEGKGYPCEYCGKVFKTLKAKIYHESEHTGSYRFQCGVCSKGYNEERQLVKHQEVHDKKTNGTGKM